MDTLTSRYLAVSTMIAKSTTAGRQPPALLAVSKFHPASAMRSLYALGQRLFGENYVQELAAKRTELADLEGMQLIFIGRLQANKIALLARTADGVQSLASERHARLLAAAVTAAGKGPLPVHLLVNAGDEASKDGLGLAAVPALAALIEAELPALLLQGVMAIPPPLTDWTPGHSEPPALYRQLRQLAAQVGAGQLSLGMSADLEAAILAGTDCVRIGTALFGPRPARP